MVCILVGRASFYLFCNEFYTWILRYITVNDLLNAHGEKCSVNAQVQISTQVQVSAQVQISTQTRYSAKLKQR